MKSFTYYAPTEVFFGCGQLQCIGELAKKYGENVLLVSGSSHSTMAVAERVMGILEREGLVAAHFDGVIPNPTTETVKKGADMAKKLGAQVVIGLGGGSAMDTAKAIAVEATHPGTAWDYNCHTEGPTEATLPVIAVGTTAGTGSQVTQCSVITRTEDKDKSAIWHRNIFPRASIVDPELTVTMLKISDSTDRI